MVNDRAQRRGLLVAGAGALTAALGASLAATLTGCATPVAADGKPQGDGPAAALLTRWRTLSGGYLAPQPAPLGLPAAGPSGMYVRWTTPGAVALRGLELLVADVGSGRLWRTDVAGQAISAIAGVSVGPLTRMALGPDLSAWVLEPGARELLRFARDGRLVQSQRLALSLAAPRSLLQVDGGATVLLADEGGATWSEWRAGSVLRQVRPTSDSGQRVSGVDDLAPAPRGLYVLDRRGGVVHQCTREGQVLHTLGAGVLAQPHAVAADARGRVYVHDAQDGALVVLTPSGGSERWSVARLGVQRIGGLAADGSTLAVSDALGAQVHLYSIAAS